MDKKLFNKIKNNIELEPKYSKVLMQQAIDYIKDTSGIKRVELRKFDVMVYIGKSKQTCISENERTVWHFTEYATFTHKFKFIGNIWEEFIHNGSQWVLKEDIKRVQSN